MTDTKLLALYRERMTRLDATNRHGGGTLGALRKINPEKRDEIDMASSAFRAADKAIVEELLERGKPAELPGVTLHLTRDRLNFVALTPDTYNPLGWGLPYVKNFGMRNMLHAYKPVRLPQQDR